MVSPEVKLTGVLPGKQPPFISAADYEHLAKIQTSKIIPTQLSSDPIRFTHDLVRFPVDKKLPKPFAKWLVYWASHDTELIDHTPDDLQRFPGIKDAQQTPLEAGGRWFWGTIARAKETKKGAHKGPVSAFGWAHPLKGALTSRDIRQQSKEFGLNIKRTATIAMRVTDGFRHSGLFTPFMLGSLYDFVQRTTEGSEQLYTDAAFRVSSTERISFPFLENGRVRQILRPEIMGGNQGGVLYAHYDLRKLLECEPRDLGLEHLTEDDIIAS